MTDADERLPGEIARRSWIVFVVLLVLSLGWQSRAVTLGVATGGLVAIGGYTWLHLSLLRALGQPVAGAANRFQRSYIIRLGALALILFGLVALLRVNPIALVFGLSVVVFSIFWTTVRRIYPARRP